MKIILYNNCLISAVIYVIDSNNKDRLAEAQNELAKLVQEKELREASLLIFVNKQVINNLNNYMKNLCCIGNIVDSSKWKDVI